MLQIGRVEFLLFLRKFDENLLLGLIRKLGKNVLLHTTQNERMDSKIQFMKLFFISVQNRFFIFRNKFRMMEQISGHQEIKD